MEDIASIYETPLIQPNLGMLVRSFVRSIVRSFDRSFVWFVASWPSPWPWPAPSARRRPSPGPSPVYIVCVNRWMLWLLCWFVRSWKTVGMQGARNHKIIV